MKICWVLSEQTKPDVVDIETLKDVAPTWGSCNTHRHYNVDNIVCCGYNKASELITRNAHHTGNLYVPAQHFITLGQPADVNIYEGEFKSNDINHKDDIIALNLVIQNYDIVLLLGFSLAKPKSKNELDIHKQNAYLHNIKTIINDNKDTQFVIINYRGKLSKEFSDLENLSRDSLINTVGLLTS